MPTAAGSWLNSTQVGTTARLAPASAAPGRTVNLEVDVLAKYVEKLHA